MESLYSEFSILADEAMHDAKSFDPSKIDHILQLFKHEANKSWSDAMSDHDKLMYDTETEVSKTRRNLDFVMDSAVSKFHQSKSFVDAEGSLIKKD
ncbi:hypothetical protein LUZ60_001299 [Juncus effusus]|nr:hypothetical protein LUZ60_001299 [Juncus effusus]